MFKVKTVVILMLLLLAQTGWVLAESCPNIAADGTYEDVLLRYEDGTYGVPGFYQTIIKGTASLVDQFGPDNCLFTGQIIVQSVTNMDGNLVEDPFFSNIVEGSSVPFVGTLSMPGKGKEIRIDRTVGVNLWHETGVLTEYDRASDTYLGSEYVITDKNMSGKGKSTGEPFL